jgi:hypothetical protein
MNKCFYKAQTQPVYKRSRKTGNKLLTRVATKQPAIANYKRHKWLQHLKSNSTTKQPK